MPSPILGDNRGVWQKFRPILRGKKFGQRNKHLFKTMDGTIFSHYFRWKIPRLRLGL
jgi:hypothetical protein